jgi:maleylpyruvate isomerase
VPGTSVRFVPRPWVEIAACAESHARLEQTLSGLGPDASAAPSLLLGWTVAHVLGHLALNGDSVVRRVQAAAQGRVVEQYDGGVAGRASAIEQAARAGLDQLVTDLRRVDAAVDRAFADLPEATWDQPVLAGDGQLVPAAHLAFSRWREVETHHGDLGVGYTTAQWPQALVDRWLPSLLEGLIHRSDQRALMAWTLGRGPAPALQHWG